MNSHTKARVDASFLVYSPWTINRRVTASSVCVTKFYCTVIIPDSVAHAFRFFHPFFLYRLQLLFYNIQYVIVHSAVLDVFDNLLAFFYFYSMQFIILSLGLTVAVMLQNK